MALGALFTLIQYQSLTDGPQSDISALTIPALAYIHCYATALVKLSANLILQTMPKLIRQVSKTNCNK